MSQADFAAAEAFLKQHTVEERRARTKRSLGRDQLDAGSAATDELHNFVETSLARGARADDPDATSLLDIRLGKGKPKT